MAPRFVCAHVRAMDAHTPGETSPPGERVIKLNTTENPFPPSPKVMQAIRDIEPETLRRYPDPSGQLFREAVAKALGNDIAPDMILCANGADDLLTIATRTFVGHGGTLAAPMPGYPLYPTLAEIEEAKFVGVNWYKNWALPTEDLLATKSNAIYLANPNTPSGTMVAAAEVAKLANEFSGALLIDEACVDFANESCLSLLKDHNNIVIARSLSKGYCLAGLRFGYAIAQSAVIEEMNKVRGSYHVDAIALIAAAAAIDDREHAAMTWEHVRSERARLTSELESLGWQVVPSHANFILAKVPEGDGQAMYDGLKRQGILVRHFQKSPLADKIQITIGTSQENNALLGGIKALSTAEKAA
ncbi:MAG: histidinol-phosphate transaminase [Anaerolineae bacterium]|nr:histidinol-phosphate transaminase [Phycisphaerae bacterium]